MVEVGIHLPTRGILFDSPDNPDIGLVFRMAKQAEDYGYDSLWVGDSLVARPRLDHISCLGALAVATKRPKLGTAVALPGQRHPIQLAQHLATIDLISNGRLIYGVGIGSGVADYYFEWEALGISPKERRSRLEEVVHVCRLLWTGEPVTHHGRHFKLDNVRLLPRPVQRPGVPIWFATGHGRWIEAQFQRVVDLGDGVMMNLSTPDEVRRIKEEVLTRAERAGRDPNSLHFSMYMSVHIGPDPEKAAREGEEWLVKYYHRNWWGDRWGPFGPAEMLVERMHAYIDAGVQSFVMRFAAYDPMTQLDLFTEHVLPHVRQRG